MLEAPDVRVPGAEVEVEIALAVVLGFGWRGGLQRCWREGRGAHDCGQGLQGAAERAEREITSDTPEQFHYLLPILGERAASFTRRGGCCCELRGSQMQG